MFGIWGSLWGLCRSRGGGGGGEGKKEGIERMEEFFNEEKERIVVLSF